MRTAGVVLSLALLTACLSAAQPAAPQAPRFDGKRAFEHIRKLVEIGPRPAGSPGAAKTREYITSELKVLGLTVQEQAFEAAMPTGPTRTVNLRTTIAGTNGTEGPRLIIGGHYDTKLFKEFDFVGASDGGSSTAFLIELVFFDGEEAVVDWNMGNDNTYGSRHYVAEAQRDGSLKDIHAMILIDMVGDRDLRIMRDTNSTPWLTDIFWSAAKQLGHRQFVDEAMDIQDDHIPFLKAGVPSVDIIDLDYPAWHTEHDTIDKVSAESLQVVGDVLLAGLPDVLRRRTR